MICCSIGLVWDGKFVIWCAIGLGHACFAVGVSMDLFRCGTNSMF